MISDEVDLAAFGEEGHSGSSRGAPVEMAFSPDGKTAWVSNYSMYGEGFAPEGKDACTGPEGFADTHRTAEHVADLLGVGAADSSFSTARTAANPATSGMVSGEIHSARPSSPPPITQPRVSSSKAKIRKPPTTQASEAQEKPGPVGGSPSPAVTAPAAASASRAAPSGPPRNYARGG